MPTDTFFNLSDEKKRRILEAAIDEFAEYRFSDASINRIVKNADISRGSFYQYFLDKEDLYLFIMQVIAQEKVEIFANAKIQMHPKSFFEAIRMSIPSVQEWVKRCPKYNKIAMLMTHDDSDIIKKVVDKVDTAREASINMIRQDQANGIIRADIDPNLVLEIYTSMSYSILRDYYKAESETHSLDKALAVLEIIENGIIKR